MVIEESWQYYLKSKRDGYKKYIYLVFYSKALSIEDTPDGLHMIKRFIF